MRGRAVGIDSTQRPELALMGCRPKRPGAFEHCVIEPHRAVADAVMKLGRDITWLALEERGILSPGALEMLGIPGIDVEQIDEDDRFVRRIGELVGELLPHIHFHMFQHGLTFP